MNITHINSYYFSNHLHPTLVEKLSERDLMQKVFIPINKEEAIPENYNTEFRNTNFQICQCFNNFERKFWPIKMYTIWKQFCKFRKNHPAVLNHAHTLMVNGLIAWMEKMKNGTPYIVTVRNTDVNIFLKKIFIFKWLGLKILDDANAIITLSPAYWSVQLKSLYSDKVIEKMESKHFIVPNGVDDFWINNIYKSKIIHRTIKILFVGKIDRNKNLVTLLKVGNVLQTRGMEVNLTVIGSGPLLNELKKYPVNFPVKFVGFIEDKHELLKYYRSASILVNPSRTESFGLVYVEAMTQGNPVIYTKGQGFDGFFKEGTVGFGVKHLDIDEIAERIIQISENYSYFSNNAVRLAKSFSWERQIEKLISIYNSNHIH